MRWGDALAAILGTAVPIVVDLVRAFADGDSGAYRRVAKIIPSPLRAEAKLSYERARLAAMKGAKDGR